MTFETPVALLVFNRPDTTAKVFEHLRALRPARLLVAADGPRAGLDGEAELCRQVRRIVSAVDWPCRLSTRFADANQGCGTGVYAAISWVFEHEPEAIILEDDCLPDPSFFPYCAELLARWRDDERVMAISGDNFQFGAVTCAHSYYFSRYFHCWGWASWRRAWRLHDPAMPLWPALRADGWLDWLLDDPVEARRWRDGFDAVHAGGLDTWDFQWVYTIWRNSALTILPRENLVTNIGFHAQATHTRTPSLFAELPRRALPLPLDHPPHVIRNFVADATYARQAFQPTRQFVW